MDADEAAGGEGTTGDMGSSLALSEEEENPMLPHTGPQASRAPPRAQSLPRISEVSQRILLKRRVEFAMAVAQLMNQTCLRYLPPIMSTSMTPWVIS